MVLKKNNIICFSTSSKHKHVGHPINFFSKKATCNRNKSWLCLCKQEFNPQCMSQDIAGLLPSKLLTYFLKFIARSMKAE